MFNAFRDGLIAGYGIAIPVGAIAVLILGIGMRHGFRPASAAGAGAATADLVYAAIAVIAGSAVSTLLAPHASTVKLASGLVVGAIGVHGLLAMTRRLSPAPNPPPNAAGALSYYLRFVGLTMVNPLTVVYFTSLVLGLGLGANLTPGSSAIFVGGAFLASLSWQVLLAGVGTFAGRGLSPRFRLWATFAGNLIVLAIAVRILSTI